MQGTEKREQQQEKMQALIRMACDELGPRAAGLIRDLNNQWAHLMRVTAEEVTALRREIRQHEEYEQAVSTPAPERLQQAKAEMDYQLGRAYAHVPEDVQVALIEAWRDVNKEIRQEFDADSTKHPYRVEIKEATKDQHNKPIHPQVSVRATATDPATASAQAASMYRAALAEVGRGAEAVPGDDGPMQGRQP